MNPSEQLEFLLRACLFPDESGEDETASWLRETSGGPAGQPEEETAGAPRSLRAQMSQELKERLETGRPLRVYLGVDPTATSLHIGHFVQVKTGRLKTVQLIQASPL